MLLLIDIFSINKGRGYENPSLEIIVTERCSTGGCPLEEACEHCFLNQSAFLLLFRISFLCIVKIVQVLVRGYPDPLRWMVMACPFSPHSQGAWFYCSDRLPLWRW
jgi:hypothetical protein